MSINQALRQARQQRGWSQAFVAARLETSAKNVSRWECGESRPSPYFRTRLCQLFEADAQSLGFLGPPVAPASVPIPPLHDPAIPFRPAWQVIGRDDLLQNLLLTLTTNQMCALYGLPGVGKTTLAQILARHETVGTHFPDGVLWVGLGPSPDVVSELARWASLLAMPKEAIQQAQTAESLQPLVQQAIESRRMLLIIDDAWTPEAVFPFLVGGPRCATLLTTRFPHLALLVTDNTPIAVAELDEAQTVHLLTRLAPALSTLEPEQLHQFFIMTGGLPLAIMLVGKYLRLHAHSGQPRRLQAALAVLTDASTRLHLALPMTGAKPDMVSTESRSLSTIIALSDQALSEQAQAALRALSVLPAKPEAFSETVALFVSQQGAEVLDMLSDAGLLESAGPGWYWMHQTIADYAHIHLQDDLPAHRLVEYACDLCKQQGSNIVVLDQEYPTLMTALTLASQHAWLEPQLQLVQGLNFIWRVRSRYAIAEQHMHSALEATDAAKDARGAIQILCALGSLAQARGTYEQTWAPLQRALHLARQQDDPALLQQVLIGLGRAAHRFGMLEQAELHWQEALLYSKMLVTNEQLGPLLNNLGLLAQERGQIAQAEQYYLAAHAEARRTQHAERECMTLFNLGNIYNDLQGKQAQAEKYYQEALNITLRYDLKELCGLAWKEIGTMAYRRGAFEEAEDYLQKAVDLLHTLGHPVYLCHALTCLAKVMIEQGTHRRAEDYLQEALPLAPHYPYGITELRCAWGELRLRQQRLKEAEQWYHDANKGRPEGQEGLRAEISYGLARVKAAQGNMRAAQSLAQESLASMETLQYWKTDEVRQWLTLHITPESPLEASSTPEAPEQVTNSPSSQREPAQIHLACPHCARTTDLNRHSITRSGSQRYRCDACGSVFTPFPKARGKEEQVKIQAHQLAAMGMSQRAIGRHLNVHHKTVKAWLTRSLEQQTS